MKRKGFTVESRVKRFVLGRAYKATSISEIENKNPLRASETSGEENYGIETSETSDPGDAKVRERNVQENDGDCEGDANEGGEFCANKKSNQIWTSVDTEFRRERR